MKLSVYKGFDNVELKEVNILIYHELKKKYGLNFRNNTGLNDLLNLIKNEKFFSNIDYETHIYLESKGTYNFIDFDIEIIVNNLYSTRFPLKELRNPIELYKLLEESNQDIECYSEIIKINDIYFASFLPSDNSYLNKDYYEIKQDESDYSINYILNEKNFYVFNDTDLDYLSYLIESNEFNFSGIDYKKSSIKIPDVLKCYRDYFDISISIISERIQFREPRLELKKILKDMYGYDNFRKFDIYESPDKDMKLVKIGQDNIVEDIIFECENALTAYYDKREHISQNIFVTAPTGTGKSIMFLIPANYISAKYPEALSIIITPIKSLMQDQVENYNKATGKDNSGFINSDMSIVERQNIIDKIKNKEIDILYLSPELLISKSDITEIIGNRKISLMVVDEAHIVTTWGQGFRPDYWYLGEYLWKLKNASYYDDIPDFPIIAFTATAVYSPYSVEGMVTDICNSLKITGAKKYLGRAVRDDIDYTVNSYSINDITDKTKDEFYKNTESFLLSQAFEQIIYAIENNEKTLVYVPYKSHGKKIYELLIESRRDIIHKIGLYTSEEDKFDKIQLVRDFKLGDKIVVIATKAFGMGVDINDIKTVYHFAPTGTLCDYVQEVGRSARKTGMNGKGLIHYVNDKKSLMFDNQLFGMSGIKMFEIFSVMQKILRTYDRTHSQNMVISIDDFASVIDPEFIEGYDEKVVESKIKTILMMIKKHFEMKISTFPVIMARPASMFTKQYIKIKDIAFFKKHKFKEYCNKIENDIYSVNLKKLWEKYYRNLSFGQFKRLILNDSELSNVDTKLANFRKCFEPYIKLSLELSNGYSVDKAINETHIDFNFIYGLFSCNKIKGDTTKLSRVENELNNKYNNKLKAEMITQNIPGILNGLLNIEKSFNKQSQAVSYVKSKKSYRVVYSSLEKAFRNLSNATDVLNRILKDKKEVFISKKILKRVQPILSLMDMMGYANYHTIGGDSPEVQIRLNGISQFRHSLRIKEDNELFLKVRERHEISRKTLEYFFNELKTSQERKELIEYYFMGKTDEFISKIDDIRNNRVMDIYEKDYLIHKKFGKVKIIYISDDKERITILVDGKEIKVKNSNEFFNH